MKKSKISEVIGLIFIIALSLWAIKLYLSGRQSGMIDAIVMISLGVLWLITLFISIWFIKKEKMRTK